jgi:hypothetical protein
MRKFLVGMMTASVALIGLAGMANAATINVVCAAAQASCTAGDTSVSFAAGGSGTAIDLDILVTSSGNIDTFDLSARWDGGAQPLVTGAVSPYVNGPLTNFVAYPQPPYGTIVQSAAASQGTADRWAEIQQDPKNPNIQITNALVGRLTITPNGVGTVAGASTTVTVGAFLAGQGVFLAGAGEALTTNGFTINIVPEPGTASLLGLGLIGLVVAGRRSRA